MELGIQFQVQLSFEKKLVPVPVLNLRPGCSRGFVFSSRPKADN